jgi:hypothetical protein
MQQLFTYYGKYQGVRGNFATLPGWARGLIFVAALPGLLLAVLSLIALGVSILALLLLTVPVYRLATMLASGRKESEFADIEVSMESAPPMNSTPGRRQVDVKIIE